MGVLWTRVAQGLLDEDLARSVGDMVLTADHMGYPHLGVVYNYCQVVQWLLQVFSNHKVFKLGGVKSNLAFN